ncbi:MAG TPA: restriction endonuclease subunit S [Paludibacteraceae bacterium]|nr:restriction endonuclease subunit S [Paludibacteraceae bacterium]
MKIAITKNSWLHGSDLRLDASFHLSEGRQAKNTIQMLSVEKQNLSKISLKIYNGARFKRVYVSDENRGIAFMGSSDMLKSDFYGLKYLSKVYTKNISELLIKKDWILVSCSGTIGNTVYTSLDFDGKSASQHIMRIIPDNSKIKSGYLYAYLSSKYGYSLLTQGTYGAVIQHIEPEHIENIPVPIIPENKQLEIHNLIAESAELRVEANKLLKNAVNYFNQKYSSSKIETTKVFSKKISQINFSWAAYNNNIESDEIMNRFSIEKVAIKDISEDVFVPPMFKHIYLEKNNGNPFLTGSELTQQNPKFYRYLSTRGVKNIIDYKVQKGTLLLYKSGTTDGGILGNVFIVDDLLNGACLSDHVIRINMKEIRMSYWVYAFLKSNAGIHLLKRLATGSMIPFITPDKIKELHVPKPDDSFDWVANCISEYISKNTLSNIKENQAIQLVENEIEQWQH